MQRDLFAGMAMQAILASRVQASGNNLANAKTDDIAAFSYDIADEMMLQAGHYDE
jgi:flagellar basal body rod protein FlgG